ncbi:MAG: NUDIX hydrolase [Candidatus Wallbacteria bacterium]|nr:NUDIX hydrolase [Candidatus Wallbacteria bacterium]
MIYQNPSLTVDGLIYDSRRLLLIKRKNEPFADCWALPGGFVDYGETVEHALRREMLEETSLRVSNIYLFGVFSDPDRDPRSHTASIIYLIPTDSLAQAKPADDAKETSLFPFKELPDLKLAFDHNKIISEFVKFLSDPALYLADRLPCPDGTRLRNGCL